MTIDVREHLRAIRLDLELAEQVAPIATNNIASKVAQVTYASGASNSSSTPARSRRWFF